jgi:transposase
MPAPAGNKRRLQEVTTHSTMTKALTELANRLVELRVERLVMDAASSYRKPVFYLLEAHGLDPSLVNARDVKHLLGGPKPDVLDTVWLRKVAERPQKSSGCPGRAMLAALAAGKRDPTVLAQLARARMRGGVGRGNARAANRSAVASYIRFLRTDKEHVGVTERLPRQRSQRHGGNRSRD